MRWISFRKNRTLISFPFSNYKLYRTKEYFFKIIDSKYWVFEDLYQANFKYWYWSFERSKTRISFLFWRIYFKKANFFFSLHLFNWFTHFIEMSDTKIGNKVNWNNAPSVVFSARKDLPKVCWLRSVVYELTASLIRFYSRRWN